MAIVIGLSTAENFNLTGESDKVWANGGSDTVNGNGGNDTIWGGDEDNAPDFIFGGEGNDILGGEGADSVYGWTGQDTLRGGNGDDLVLGDQDNDQVYGEGGNDGVFGWTGADSLFGGEGNDIVAGEEGHDYAEGNNGNDGIYGGQGNDTLVGGNGGDWIVGDDTDDAGTGTPVTNTVTVSAFSAGGESVAATVSASGNTVSFGDAVAGGRFENEIDYVAGVGSEKLVVDFGAENVTSAAVSLKLFYIDAGNHLEVGQWRALDAAGNVVASASFNGDDTASIDPAGNYTLSISSATAFQKIEFTSLQNTDTGNDNSDYRVESLTYTTQVVSTITNSNDVLFGNADNDALFGMQGDDTLNGGADAGTLVKTVDTLTYSAGDNLTGGNGADVFVFNKGEGVDQIHDFTHGVDKIRLVGFTGDYNSVVNGNFTNMTDGTATVLTFGTNEGIVFVGDLAASFTASDFIFA